MNILITAGGTREYIDPVRFISNASTGKMGYALVRAETETRNTPPPGHEYHNTLPAGRAGKIVSGSDGSVHLRQRLVTSAWMATTSSDQHRSACFLMTDCNSISSYRSELEGVYRLLRSIEHWGLKPESVEHWCDNERSVMNTEEAPYGASSTTRADADLVLAIHHLKQKLSYPVKCRHVYGHQDGKNKGKKKEATKVRESKEEEPKMDMDPAVAAMFQLQKPKATDTKAKDHTPEKIQRRAKLPREALINVACDQLASGTTAAMLAEGEPPPGEILKLPYPGSKALLKIGDKWITSRYKDAIYRARRTHKMRT